MPRRSKASRRREQYEERHRASTEADVENELSDEILEEPKEDQRNEITACTGIVSELGGCPVHILRQALQMTSLYDRCGWGATSAKMRDAVVAMGIGIPVIPKSIESDPESLLTPPFKDFISLLLQFYLPAACPHAKIFYQLQSAACLSPGVNFLCQSCGGSIKFKLVAIKALSQEAYCTVGDKNAVRLRCMKFINGVDKPIVTGTNSKLELKKGHTCEVMLKMEEKKTVAPIKNVAADKLGTKCTCTQSPDPSGDEGQFGPRCGRRKTRRGVRPSRTMQEINRDLCQSCQSKLAESQHGFPNVSHT